MGYFFKLLITTLVAVMLTKVYKIAMLMGIGRVIHYHAPGPCRIVDGIVNGSEDIQVLQNGMAFISSGLVFPGVNTGNEFFRNLKGQIYLFDFKQPDKKPALLKVVGDEKVVDKLNPHGMSLWTDSKGEVYLYVISHLPDQEEAVEKFRYDGKTKTLHHITRVSSMNHDNIRLLNDLVVVGDNQFYYTNYLHTKIPHLETGLQLYWGSIGFYDGQKASIVADGLLMPNGINKSPDSNFIYLSHIGEQELRVYTRHENNSLELKQTQYVGTLMDNLDVDQDTGDIWTGAHPIGYMATPHLEDPYNVKAPSQVLQLHMKDGLFVSSSEIYEEEGHFISGSSIAVHYKGAMLVGSVNHNLLYCKILNK